MLPERRLGQQRRRAAVRGATGVPQRAVMSPFHLLGSKDRAEVASEGDRSKPAPGVSDADVASDHFHFRQHRPRDWRAC
eukprot:6449109-Prymnesium_polylepis.1